MLVIENYFLWNLKRSQDEAPMCSRVYFYRGNEKQTRTNLKNINVVLLRTSHSLKVPYASRISYRVLNLVFSRGRVVEGRLFQISSLRRSANSKRGAYLKLGAKNPDPLRPGGLPYNRDGDARRTIRIEPLNEINLGMAQHFFDKGDHISSNTVWQCLFFISRYFFTHWGWDWLKSSSLALRDTFIGKNIGFLSWAH